MKNIKFILYLITLCITGSFYGQALKVGEEILKVYESPHPYSNSSIAWSQRIKYEGATYIAVHFNKFELAPGDFLLVKSPDSDRSWKYTEKGNSTYSNEGFWSIPVYGDELVIEIHKNSNNNYYGYYIDKFARGYTEKEVNSERVGDFESLCGADDSANAICYQTSEPNAYNRSRAVARLLINGTGACTGWLIGDQGHIMTNNHCVGTSSDANNVTVEFMAQGSTCATNCQTWFGCPGTIVATTTGLVQTNVNLDYSLLSLATNVTGTYGFLQLRQAGATLGERIYIPQHPQAWGKRIALLSSHPNDSADGFAHANSTSEPRCGGTGSDVGYFADTQGGSSGSPVLGHGDNLVIALHHCGNCPNRGVPIQEIITNLGANIPNNAIGCAPALTITANVTSGINNRQASISINALNSISSGATGIYHAGSEVLLTNGFTSVNGSIFRAHIEGCTGNFVARHTENEISYNENNEKNININEIIRVSPNPNNGIFNIILKNDLKEGTIQITDLIGLTVYKANFKDQKEIEVNIQENPKGIYIVKVFSGDQTYTEKIIKN